MNTKKVISLLQEGAVELKKEIEWRDKFMQVVVKMKQVETVMAILKLAMAGHVLLTADFAEQSLGCREEIEAKWNHSLNKERTADERK